MRYVGAAVAAVALFGYVGFGWRFEASNGLAPLVIGIVCAVVAVVWMVRR